jgi:hypothetical protein
MGGCGRGRVAGRRRCLGGTARHGVRDVRWLLRIRLLNGGCGSPGRPRNAPGLGYGSTGVRRLGHGRRGASRGERLAAPMSGGRLGGLRGARYGPYRLRSEAVRRLERQVPGSGTKRGQRRHADERRPHETAALRHPHGVGCPVGTARLELSADPIGSPNLLRRRLGRELIPPGASPTDANEQARRDQLRQVGRSLGAVDTSEALVLGSGQGRTGLRGECQKRSPLSGLQLGCLARDALWHYDPPATARASGQ